MPYQYGDSVVLVRKSPDGSISRVNAIVAESATQPPNVNRSAALKDHRGVLPAGEFLSVWFPRALPPGPLKHFGPESIFQFAASVPRWKDGAQIGWEPGSTTAVAPVPPPPISPSAADLDAVADEQKAAEATVAPKKKAWGK